jgi:hypothetical protein
MVAEVVSVVLTTIGHDLSAKKALLLREVEELGCTIAVAKVEIAALQVDDIKEREIPFATDELDAIVEHTAQATNDILESCERVDEVPAARPCVLTSPATLFVPPGPSAGRARSSRSRHRYWPGCGLLPEPGSARSHRPTPRSVPPFHPSP